MSPPINSNPTMMRQQLVRREGVNLDSSDEDLAKTKLHLRHSTGVIGTQHTWSDDPEINELWEQLAAIKIESVSDVQKTFVRHIVTTLARTQFNTDTFAAYNAAAETAREQLITQWNHTQQHHTWSNTKRVYYLSMEFLMGRTLDNAILNLGMKPVYAEALLQLGFRLEDLIEEEVDAALGNGGLGRLAACFMDSLATLDYPAWGYGLRYTYGIFQQQICQGYQVEFPDYWLNFGNPWEVPRLDMVYEVRFGGYVTRRADSYGRERHVWRGGEKVQAVAYDVPIPGFGTKSTINIRLWSSKPKKIFDFQLFNEGNYQQSVEEQQMAENITSVLYPNDNTMAGKELRLKQQYFFVSATLQDILRRFRKSLKPWSDFPEQVAIQLNDTHPALSIPELLRLLIDKESLGWDEAWEIVTRVFSFTNHTVLPEAMEKWPVSMLERLLPRHMQIIYDINLFFLQRVEEAFPDDRDLLARLSLIEENPYRQVRMAHLAVVGSHTVNGVAAIHSSLIRTTIFRDFVRFYGSEKFTNITNGITPRRWLHQANPALSALISQTLGNEEWLRNLEQLEGIGNYANDPSFQAAWMSIKTQNKERLAKVIEERCDVKVDPQNALFDVQTKRIHEYKRQFMNILGVIYRYLRLLTFSADKLASQVPRVVIFGGKAAPGYYIAKLVIKLINSVAEIVNADGRLMDKLKVVFIPDYNVSLAEVIVPASDISQHISTAGTEASGTSNMKFVLNGGLILGTMDGANIEIGEEIGSEENMYIFGCRAEEVEDLRHRQKYRKVCMDLKLETVIYSILGGQFGNPEIFAPLLDTLTVGGDYYLISNDFEAYLEAQDRIDSDFCDKTGWARKSILAASKMGKFSSDRSIREYAQRIWKLEPCPMPVSGEEEE